MVVSYKLLYQEEEPQAISVDMTRDCIELPKAEAEQTAKKRASMPLREVEELIFSYRDLVKIENLWGLDKLTKLKLDCNRITKIEHLSHLTHLTWLDLSFNEITKIEGLDSLVNLTDLSLLDNKISELESLDNLKQLQCLSLGKNNLNKLDNMLYLRQFECLESVSLAGNPLCREANYKSYLCSHIKNLKYLDYVRVKADDVSAAMEAHQDEMLDLKEKEELSAEEAKAAGAAAREAALAAAANLAGVSALFDDLTRDDPDWAKLAQVPGLTEGWHEVRDKWGLEVDSFRATMLDKHAAKQAELQRWRAAVAAVCEEKDGAARARVLTFEKARKAAVRRMHDEGARPPDFIPSVKEQLADLKHFLMGLELTTVDALDELLATFDSHYGAHAEATKRAIMAFFATARELQGNYNTTLVAQGQKLQDEKFTGEASEDMGALQEEARHLATDKDALQAALQAVHELRCARLDTLEDTLINTEAARATELVAKHADWAYTRNRDRVVEIVAYTDRNTMELDTLLKGDEDDE